MGYALRVLGSVPFTFAGNCLGFAQVSCPLRLRTCFSGGMSIGTVPKKAQDVSFILHCLNLRHSLQTSNGGFRTAL